MKNSLAFLFFLLLVKINAQTNIYHAGVDEFALNDGINIYPNQDTSTIQSLGSTNHTFEIKIYVAMGNLIQTTNITNQKYTADISSLPNGK